jgi:NADH-quinone oxidoreductase subunit J
MEPMIHFALFFLFGGLCVAAAINLLIQKHPIHSALSLIVVMGSLALLYLLLGAEFVAAVQLIVYAGAIMVLFVFVIMLLNAQEEEHEGDSKVAHLLAVPVVATLAGMLIYMITSKSQAQAPVTLGSFSGSTSEIAMLLFTKYLLPFEVTSVLILIAILGAVVLTRKEHQS